MQFNNENNGIQNPHTGEVDTNKLLLSAINSAKLRQNKKKRKKIIFKKKRFLMLLNAFKCF